MKSRDEQHTNIGRLKGEIEDLEREKAELSLDWERRREQLRVISNEAQRLRRVIRDEKEPEVEDDGEKSAVGEAQDEDMLQVETGSAGGRRSRSTSVVPDQGNSTPMPGNATPLHSGLQDSGGRSTPRPHDVDKRMFTPLPEVNENRPEPAAGEDVDMVERSEDKHLKIPTGPAAMSDKMDTS